MLKWILVIFVVSLVLFLIGIATIVSEKLNNEVADWVVDKFCIITGVISVLSFIVIIFLSVVWFVLYQGNVSAVEKLPELEIKCNALYEEMKENDEYTLKLEFEEISRELKDKRATVKDYQGFRAWVW